MTDFFSYTLLGNSVRQWLLMTAWIAGGLIGGILCSLFLSWLLINICKKNKFKLDDLLVKKLKHPLTVLITLNGIKLGMGFLSFSPGIKLWTERGMAILFILVVTWGITRLFDALIVHYVPVDSPAGSKEAELQPLLRKLFGGLATICAGGLILRTLGYDVSALMAGLGLGGAAIALASKDTLSNFFGSIAVFVDRPFHINDRIKIAGFDGVITNMGIRTSRLRTMENRVVIIPNSIFAANPIENISAEPNTRVVQLITVKRDKEPEKLTLALSLLREIGSDLEGTDDSPAAGLSSIGGMSCQINFVYYVAKNADYLDTVNRVNLEILRRFEEAGISLV
jgi:MscS family membrane protein